MTSTPAMFRPSWLLRREMERRSSTSRGIEATPGLAGWHQQAEILVAAQRLRMKLKHLGDGADGVDAVRSRRLALTAWHPSSVQR